MKTVLLHSLLAIAATTAVSTASAAAPSPLGMTIGTTSCADAMKRIHATKLEGKELLRTADSEAPGEIYPGAEAASIFCRGDKLDGVALTVGKGGMGNPAAQEAYKMLAGKYKRIAGGPIPSLGDGMARFESDGVTVHLVSPHLSFTFNVVYLSKELMAATAREQQERADATVKAKANAL